MNMRSNRQPTRKPKLRRGINTLLRQKSLQMVGVEHFEFLELQNEFREVFLLFYARQKGHCVRIHALCCWYGVPLRGILTTVCRYE